MTAIYVCKGCGVRAMLVDAKVVRPCNCPPETGVSAEMRAVAYGQSKTAGK